MFSFLSPGDLYFVQRLRWKVRLEAARLSDKELLGVVNDFLTTHSFRLLQMKYRDRWKDTDIAKHYGISERRIREELSQALTELRNVLKEGPGGS